MNKLILGLLLLENGGHLVMTCRTGHQDRDGHLWEAPLLTSVSIANRGISRQKFSVGYSRNPQSLSKVILPELSPNTVTGLVLR